MLRYPKNRLLYITLESDVDCSPSLKLAQNKKDATEVTVNMMTSQSKNEIEDESDDEQVKPKQTASQLLGDEELEKKAKMSLETLALMLGGEEKTQHVAKLNLLVKKKISYMINEDLDVAKDFLDLVEILK